MKGMASIPTPSPKEFLKSGRPPIIAEKVNLKDEPLSIPQRPHHEGTSSLKRASQRKRAIAPKKKKQKKERGLGNPKRSPAVAKKPGGAGGEKKLFRQAAPLEDGREQKKKRDPRGG